RPSPSRGCTPFGARTARSRARGAAPTVHAMTAAARDRAGAPRHAPARPSTTGTAAVAEVEASQGDISAEIAELAGAYERERADRSMGERTRPLLDYPPY